MTLQQFEHLNPLTELFLIYAILTKIAMNTMCIFVVIMDHIEFL